MYKMEISYGTKWVTDCYECGNEQAVWTVYYPEIEFEELLCDRCKERANAANNQSA